MGRCVLLRKRDADRAIVAINHFDPVCLLQVHDVRSAVPQDHARLVAAVAQNVVEILLNLFLEVGDVGPRRFAHAAAVQIPTLVAVVNLDDILLRKIFLALLERRLRIINELSKPGDFARMIELANPARARHIVDVQVGVTAERLDGLIENLPGLRGALLRHQKLIVLRGRACCPGEAQSRQRHQS